MGTIDIKVSEVLQLMMVMDNMLKEAGVDEVDLKMEGPTQIHNLLSLLKTEQNIYNIVFHELIRQVSVDCAERGQLLGKIRQRYVMLLNKIPQQVMSLYEDLLAQRALDRSLTEEIIIFKNSIGELTRSVELSQVREHDLRVSKDAKQAQAELARALEDAKKNANLSEEYRELYELQRNRLEKHMVHLTEERDLWSSATYRLARKGTADLSKIQETTETWRWHMARFDKEVQRNEESSKEKLRIIRGDLEKWLCHFQQKMVNEELQQFEGSLLLNSQESLKTAAKLQKNWFQMTHKLLQRHRSMDGKEAPEQKAMEEVNNKVFVLCEHYRRRVEGENVLMSISGGLENWSLQLSTLKLAPYGIRESEWMNTYQLIPEWITLTDKALELIGSTSTENESTTNQDEKYDRYSKRDPVY
uniref:Axonemal dynein light chain domain containing 1 n=1 Tax=Leptobrachium leishanense TaxID=445787 RepID=A0A8C5R610_9ANUR